MKAVWVDAGNDADYAKLKRYGIDSPYFDIRDPRVTTAYLEGVRDHTDGPWFPGVYACSQGEGWPTDLSGPKWAEWVSARLAKLPARLARACLDCETHDIRGWVLPMLARYRQLRPKRVTDYALEAFQGGLFYPPDVIAITNAKVGVVPSNYAGDMTPLAADRVALNLVSAGFNWSILHGFYDGAALPREWDGYVFTQGRLP